MTSSSPCDPVELRSLFLFEKLSDEQLAWLCREGTMEQFDVGPVYREGDEATCFFVLVEGTVVTSRRVGTDDVEVGRTSQSGVYGGAWNAYLDSGVSQTYQNSMRATRPCRFFVLDAAKLNTMMHDWFPMAVHLLEGMFYGLRTSQAATAQRERLLALGSLSAGLTHELNNPAAAAVRATETLRGRVSGMRHKLGLLASGKVEPETLRSLVDLQERTAELVAKAPDLSPMETNDREDEIADWMQERGLARAWDIAPIFVAGGLDVPWLEQVEASAPPGTLDSALGWLSYTVETELLMDEIRDSTMRISHLVDAAKQYSQLDRAPYQLLDLRALLKSTIVMMSGRFGPGVTVVKDLAADLPPVPGYGAELNQVWTNLIDNAVAAMHGEGTLTVRAFRDDGHVVIEIGDTGEGIAPDVQPRIFEPFFTTKPVGEGTGLGLDISWRIVVNKHHGDLAVRSVPGDTVFTVRLPIEQERSD